MPVLTRRSRYVRRPANANCRPMTLAEAKRSYRIGGILIMVMVGVAADS